MKIKKPEVKGGWQMWVEIYDNHVIKKPKSKEEIKEKVEKYLKWIKATEKPDKKVNQALEDIQYSLSLINKSKIPSRFLAYPEFLEEGKIKQKKAVVVRDELLNLRKNNQQKKAEKLIDDCIKFVTFLWGYGIHEKTFKITSNFGILENKIVLIDFLELSGNKKVIEKKLRKQPWHHYKKMSTDYSEEILDYYIKQADKTFTINNLNKLWKSKLK